MMADKLGAIFWTRELGNKKILNLRYLSSDAFLARPMREERTRHPVHVLLFAPMQLPDCVAIRSLCVTERPTSRLC